jgi:hypothetical protein
MPAAAGAVLRQDHERIECELDSLKEITDSPDDAEGAAAVVLISRANKIVSGEIVRHERNDEAKVYPKLTKFLVDGHGLGAMSRAHREIIHLAHLLRQLADGLIPADTDRYLIRDAQRVIESIEVLVARVIQIGGRAS